MRLFEGLEDFFSSNSWEVGKMKDDSFALLYCHRQAMGFSDESEYSSKDVRLNFSLLPVELNLEFFVSLPHCARVQGSCVYI